MNKRLQLPCLMALFLMLSACATLQPDIDPPKVSLESFKPLASEGGAPRFEIQLRVANPNKQAFDIAGISYSVEIQGQELISGVTNEVPRLEPYSEEVVTFEAGLQLFQLVRLLAGMGMEPTDALEYRFLGKIDFKGFVPTQRIEETGNFTLR